VPQLGQRGREALFVGLEAGIELHGARKKSRLFSRSPLRQASTGVTE
jgi:hypothetical protein